MPDETTGALAAALAKAQAAFPPIPREKTVTVATKTGGSYSFKYAPLDSILSATRKPLTDNGLAILQLLDEDVLVTSLLHSSGAILSGRTPIPASEGIQAYGSAITYLRRYAITALLGIAAEEDDDGNAAAGNRATFGGPAAPSPEPVRDGLIGTAEKNDKMTTDYAVRQVKDPLTGEITQLLGFRIKDGSKSGFICEAWGSLATALAVVESEVIGQRVQVWGQFVNRSIPGKDASYRAFVIDRIATQEWTLPAKDAPSLPMFSEEEDRELDAALSAA